MHVGASLGMAPRFATAHLATHNLAVAGVRKSFTSLPDEFLFIDENTRGILALQRAADALTRIVHARRFEPRGRRAVRCGQAGARGCRSAVNDRLFDRARRASASSIACGRTTSPTGSGARSIAAPMPAISPASTRSICCWACAAPTIPYYAQLLVDKMLFMLPQDQARLRDCMSAQSLLDELLAAARCSIRDADWFQQNARAFLEVCDLFAQTAAQHHDVLVKRFIEQPARKLGEEHLQGITASGPPLPVLLRSLEMLRDLRVAAKRSDIATRHDDLAKLRGLLKRAALTRACVSILSTRSG